jgi:MOSC domain-containing protein
MPRVVALYRYPVKGFTPEECHSLTILDEGRVAGDRVLAFRFANSAAPDAAWTRKHDCVVLMNTPGLARLDIRFDHRAQRLRIGLDGGVLADDALDEGGRKRLAAAVERYVLETPENPLSGHAQRLPLRLVGDGATPRFHDNLDGHTTLHGRGSLTALSVAAHDPALSEVRFRSNIAVGGLGAWEELGWMGRKLRVGEVEFEVVKRKVRCLATHANPQTGERDVPVMATLMRAFSQAEPTFAVGMTTRGAGGVVRIGDSVSLMD